MPPLSNETLTEKFTDLKDFLEEKFRVNEESHQGIKDRLDHTNGNVTEAQKNIINLEKWRSMLVGGFFILTAIGATTIYLWTSNLRNEISEQIMADLEDKYEVILK